MTAALVRACGALLVALVALPVYRLLDGREIGLMGEDILKLTEQDRALLLIGTPIALVAGLIAARIVDWPRIAAWSARIGRALQALPSVQFAAALGILAALYAAGFSLWILDAKPNLIDSMAQLLHARFVAAGDLAGPVNAFNEFWHIQNSLVTPHGWVSQYPPGHVILLAAGIRLGAVWAVGPIMCGVAIFFTALAADRLLPEDRAVARLGALLAAASPFFVAHSGAYMNHVSAAATGAAAVYFALRARDSTNLVWPVLAGAAAGAAFTVRPLAAVVTAATVAVIFATGTRAGTTRVAAWARAAVAAAAGATPFAIAIGAYNAHFFGSPFRFGYEAAWGPATGLGFHRDPWGNNYGPVEAIGFTSSDFTALSLHLLGTAIPVVLVIGLFLMLARRLTAGERIVALWALLPVAANALYWHHGIFMGPRMLNEAAPAWALLAAIAGVGLVRRIPTEWEARGYSLRGGVAIALVLATVTGLAYLGPDRLVQYGRDFMTSTRIVVPVPAERALVFVHGGWTGRIAARLAAHGMRLDSMETALRRNATCDVHHFTTRHARDSADDPQPSLDFTLRSGDAGRAILTATGNRIRVRDDRPLTRECLREAAADTLGIVDVAPLIWQSSSPGLPEGPMIVARDMGPETNATLIAAHPDRVPLMFMRTSDDAAPTLLPYDVGISMLWPGFPPRER